MPEKSSVIPFGKHKGKLIEELLENDPKYVDWLQSQDWFRDKFVNLYQIIINRGAESQDTPEHNQLQAMFLDDEFCRRFTLHLYPNITDFKDTKERFLRHDFSSWKNDSWRDEINIDPYSVKEEDFYKWLEEIKVSNLNEFVFVFKRRFEYRGTDAILDAEVKHKDLKSKRRQMIVEIKPTVGDDFPTVMRQMNTNQSTILFLKEYNGTGVSRDQFIKMFQSSPSIRSDEGKRVVFLSDVEK